MLAGPVGPLNCGIGTFSAAELEKATACRRRHKRRASLLQAGGTGGSLSERRWTDDSRPPCECVYVCVSLKVLQSFSANRAHVVIQSIPLFKVFEILQLLVVNPHSQTRKVEQIEESF